MALRMTSWISVRRFALQPLLKMYFCVALLLIAPGELSAALITTEWFLTGMRTHMSG